MFSYKTLLYTFAVLLLGACVYWRMAHKALAEDTDKKPAPPPPPPAAAAAPRPGDEIPLGALEEGVVLQSGNIKIPLKAVEKCEQMMLANAKSQNPEFTPTPDKLLSLRKGMALRLLDNELLEQYVKANKLEATKEELAKELEVLKTNIQERNMTYPQFLASICFEEEDFNRIFSANFALKQKFIATLKDEDVTAEYDRAKDQLPSRRVSHILYMYKGSERAPATVTRTKEEAQAAAAETLKKLKGGADFAELAKSGSDCPSKAQGGDLNYSPRKGRGAMVEAFAEAAYKLEKVGDLSGVVETPFGFHIIKLTALRTPETLKNDFVKEKLIEDKWGKQMQQITGEGHALAKFNEKLMPAAPPKLDVLPK